MTAVSSKPQVLLILKSIQQLNQLQLKLSRRCQVKTMTSSYLALEYARQSAPQVIVIDMSTFDTGGFEVLQQFNGDTKTHQVPVIILVSSPQHEANVLHCLDSGATDFIASSSSEDILYARIKKTIENYNAVDVLQLSHQQYHIIDAIPKMVIAVDSDDNITAWNKEAEKHIGLSNSRMIGQNLSFAFTSKEWDILSEKINECRKLADSIEPFEMKFSNNDTNNITLSFELSAVPMDNIKAGVVLLVTDITDKKISLIVTRQREKLHAIGSLSLAMANEINTPMQYIGDNLCFLHESFNEIFYFLKEIKKMVNDTDVSTHFGVFRFRYEKLLTLNNLSYHIEEIPKATGQSIEGIEQVVAMIEAIQNYSQLNSDYKTPTDIGHAIESCIAVTRHEWSKIADIQTSFDSSLGDVECYIGSFNEVIFNLIVYVCQVINRNNGDKINSRATINISTTQSEGFAEIRVRGFGQCVPDEMQENIFDSATTRPISEGIGQGLVLCRNIIIDQHAGEMLFESQENQEVTLVVRLPLENTCNSPELSMSHVC